MKLNWRNEVEKVELGDIVIYHLTDGLGATTQKAALVINIYHDAPKCADLRIFGEVDKTYKGILAATIPDESNHYSPKP